jgi:hypothetical protein
MAVKRFVHWAAIVMLLFVCGSIWADESELFVKTIPITKIYTHRLGYKIVFPAGQLRSGESYLPYEWFRGAGSKGEIVWGGHHSIPYVSIFWQNGEFHHLRLYLNRDSSDPSWGTLTDSPELSRNFDVETIRLEY